jgi:hypothetical protein
MVILPVGVHSAVKYVGRHIRLTVVKTAVAKIPAIAVLAVPLSLADDGL